MNPRSEGHTAGLPLWAIEEAKGIQEGGNALDFAAALVNQYERGRREACEEINPESIPAMREALEDAAEQLEALTSLGRTVIDASPTNDWNNIFSAIEKARAALALSAQGRERKGE